MLAVYAPGKNADTFPVGTAKRILAGSNLIFQMPYAKITGRPEKDRTSVGLILAKQPVEKIVESMLIVNEAFAIPPGAENHAAAACANLRRDADALQTETAHCLAQRLTHYGDGLVPQFDEEQAQS